MSDIKVIIGAEIKELEQKLAAAKAKLISFGQEGPRAIAPLQDRLKGLTFPTDKVDKFKDAFKGFAKNVAGPAIALAAIGVAVAGAVKWFEILKKDFITVGKSAEESAKKIKEYNDLINSITASVSKEATEVTGLVAILSNETETRKRKLSAIKELQKIQPEIFEGLRLEKNAVVGLDIAYQNYIANLRNVIAAKLIQAQIETVLTELIKLQGIANTKEQQAQLDNLKNFIAGNKQLAQTKKDLQDTKLSGGFLTDKQVNKRMAELNVHLKGLFEKLKEFSSTIKVPEIKIKPDSVTIEKPNKFTNDLEFISFFKTVGEEITRKTGAALTPEIVVKPSVRFDNSALESGFKTWEEKELKERLENMQVNAAQAINEATSNIINDSISGLADGIAEALTSGGNVFEGIFDNLIKGIGGQIKELGKYLVKIGLGMLITKKAIESLGLSPQGVVIAGFALQILGGVLTAAATKRTNQTGFATGVRNLQEGGVYNVGERGPETIYLPRGSSVRPNNEVNAYGGGNAVFIPAVSLRGSDLVIAFNRASQSMSRNG